MGSAPRSVWAMRACFHLPKKRYHRSSISAHKLSFRLKDGMLAGYVVIIPAKGRGPALKEYLPFPVEAGLVLGTGKSNHGTQGLDTADRTEPGNDPMKNVAAICWGGADFILVGASKFLSTFDTTTRQKQHRQLVRQCDKDTRSVAVLSPGRLLVLHIMRILSDMANNHEETQMQREDNNEAWSVVGPSNEPASSRAWLSRGFLSALSSAPPSHRLQQALKKSGIALQVATPKVITPHAPLRPSLC